KNRILGAVPDERATNAKSVFIKGAKRRSGGCAQKAADRRQQLAVLIVKQHLGADQIGSALSSERVRPVTEGAVHAVDRFAGLDHGGVGRWALGVGCREAASPAPSSSPASWPRCRRRRPGLGEGDGNGQKESGGSNYVAGRQDCTPEESWNLFL